MTPPRWRACVAKASIILGKTNTPELLAAYETDDFITGRTNNPWDLERTPGGSSVGEAAAIAAFCSPGGIGSDGGGSLRIPAHFCGIAGLKPTPGRISGSGRSPSLGYPASRRGTSPLRFQSEERPASRALRWPSSSLGVSPAGRQAILKHAP
jgi:hypothetical protein